jgi:hypothetical protein
MWHVILVSDHLHVAAQEHDNYRVNMGGGKSDRVAEEVSPSIVLRDFV